MSEKNKEKKAKLIPNSANENNFLKKAKLLKINLMTLLKTYPITLEALKEFQVGGY